MRIGTLGSINPDRNAVTDFDMFNFENIAVKEVTSTNNFLHPCPRIFNLLTTNYTYQANQMKALPFIPYRDMHVTTVQYRHASAGSGGNKVRVLCYDNVERSTNHGIVTGTVSPEMNFPNRLIYDGGENNADSAITTFSFPFNLTIYKNQLYWFVWWSNDAAGTARTATPFEPLLGYSTNVTSPESIMGFTISQTYGANPPARFPSASASTIVGGTPVLVLFIGGYFL
jgi:hypothetical protein